MESLLRQNAESARQLLGVPTLSVPSECDASYRLRVRSLWRSYFPAIAPPPAAAGGSAEALWGEERMPREDAPSTALMLAAAGGSSSALSRLRKRGRGHGGPDAGDDPILQIEPRELKERHQLGISSAAAEVVRQSGYTPPRTWKISKVLVGHQGWVWTVAVDPGNAWFATGGFDATIKVWDMSTGALRLDLTGHKEAVRGLALSRQSPYMFSGSDDHSIKCWDLERNEAIREFFGHRSAVHCVAVHPTLDIVLSGGRDRTVRVWDIRTRAAVHCLDAHTDSVMTMLSQQADPQVISGGSDGFICMWDLAAGKLLHRLTRHKKPVRGMAMNAARNALISCGADEIRVWALPSGEFTCNASTVVAEGGGKRRTGNSSGPSEELAYRWSSCAMSPRDVLAVASQDNDVAFFDWNRPQPAGRPRHYCPYQFTRTKSIPGTLPGEGGVNAVVYDMSGTRLLTVESDKSVKMWRLRVEG